MKKRTSVLLAAFACFLGIIIGVVATLELPGFLFDEGMVRQRAERLRDVGGAPQASTAMSSIGSAEVPVDEAPQGVAGRVFMNAMKVRAKGLGVEFSQFDAALIVVHALRRRMEREDLARLTNVQIQSDRVSYVIPPYPELGREIRRELESQLRAILGDKTDLYIKKISGDLMQSECHFGEVAREFTIRRGSSPSGPYEFSVVYQGRRTWPGSDGSSSVTMSFPDKRLIAGVLGPVWTRVAPTDF